MRRPKWAAKIATAEGELTIGGAQVCFSRPFECQEASKRLPQSSLGTQLGHQLPLGVEKYCLQNFAPIGWGVSHFSITTAHP